MIPTDPRSGYFPATPWTQLMQLRGAGVAADEALGAVCGLYWQLLRDHIRSKGFEANDAEDLTQDCLSRLVARGDFSQVDRSRGKLRGHPAEQHILTGPAYARPQCQPASAVPMGNVGGGGAAYGIEETTDVEIRTLPGDGADEAAAHAMRAGGRVPLLISGRRATMDAGNELNRHQQDRKKGGVWAAQGFGEHSSCGQKFYRGLGTRR